jgi:zinc/manganese transport system permease protein
VIAMLSQPFMQHALLAGTAVALLSGLVGYFVVLRSQMFAGDALSHVAYTGALGALAVGVDLRLGLFGATIAVAVVLGVLGGRGIADDVVIGTTFVWVLGLGVLCLSIVTTQHAAGNSTASVTVLFGSIFGVSAGAAQTAAIVAVGLSALLLAMARPLLFATLDPSVAAARGLPVRVLGPSFLAVVGATTAEATQVVGALLLFGLLAAPAASAQRLVNRPWPALALSAGLAVVSVWAGLVLAYAAPTLPPSFAVISVATGIYVVTLLVTSDAGRRVRAGWGRQARNAPGTARTPRACA